MALFSGFVACSSQQTAVPSVTQGAIASSPAPATPVLSEDLRPQVVILYVSDLHGRLRPEPNGLGGYARLATLIKTEKAKAGDKTDVIAMIGGDVAGKGALPCRKTSDVACFELLSGMGFDYAVLGSGELKRSSKDLADLINKSGLKWLSGNARALDQKSLWNSFIDFKGPRSKANLFFLSWTEGPTPGEVDLKKERLELRDKISDHDWALWEQKAKGKSVILMPHQEYADDVSMLKLACTKNDLKPLLLLKGNDHSHREEKNECAPLYEPGAYGEVMSRVVLQPDETGHWFVNSHEFLTVDEHVTEDSVIKAKVEALYKMHAPTADQVVAVVSHDYTETDFAKWAGEAFRKVAHSDIAVVNMGSIKEALKAGPLTEERLAMIYPFTDELMGFDVGTKEFEKVLCNASRRVKDSFEDYGSEIVLAGAELQNPGTDQCKISGPRKSSYKVAMVSFLIKRSKRWLGRDFSSVAFKWQVKTEEAFQKSIKSTGNKL